jgi:hypothetical protein
MMGKRPGGCCPQHERRLYQLERENQRHAREILQIRQEPEIVNQRLQAIEDTCCDA